MQQTKDFDLKFFCAPVDDKIIDLRHDVLRPGLPKDSAMFEGDELPTTLHFLAYTPQLPSLPVCCVSYFLSDWEGIPVYQLRGMATKKDFQKMGIGKKLLLFAEDFIRKQKSSVIFWCNARSEAIGFYQKQGWACFGEEFDMPDVGMHRKMIKGIASS